MNAIDQLFQRLRSEGRKAFIPFVTAGDPDLATTTQLVQQLAARGAHLVEIGFPYSDPIADGPVVQASYSRALAKGLRIDEIFTWAQKLTATAPFANGRVPLAGMVSYTLVHHRGPDEFLAKAQSAGFSGLIVPDLPVEESRELAQLAAARDLRLILLVTPTTPRDRALQILRCCTGFLYCVSVTGITGERDRLPPQLLEQLAWLRRETQLPLCVGFGISKPDHVRTLREAVDGVIVGSALVRPLESAETRPTSEIIAGIADLADSLSQALNPES